MTRLVVPLNGAITFPWMRTLIAHSKENRCSIDTGFRAKTEPEIALAFRIRPLSRHPWCPTLLRGLQPFRLRFVEAGFPDPKSPNAQWWEPNISTRLVLSTQNVVLALRSSKHRKSSSKTQKRSPIEQKGHVDNASKAILIADPKTQQLVC